MVESVTPMPTARRKTRKKDPELEAMIHRVEQVILEVRELRARLEERLRLAQARR